MKKIQYLAFISLYLITYYSFSQNTIKPIENLLTESEHNNRNVYFKDTNLKLQNCVGTWLYDNGSDYFKITFFKTKTLINDKYNVYSDVLNTKFFYKKNGIVIYDNFNSTPSAGSNSKNSQIISGHVKNENIAFIYTEPSFNECNRNKLGILRIHLLATNPQQMSWIRETNVNSFLDDQCDNGVDPDTSDFLIPQTMLLTKIN